MKCVEIVWQKSNTDAAKVSKSLFLHLVSLLNTSESASFSFVVARDICSCFNLCIHSFSFKKIKPYGKCRNIRMLNLFQQQLFACKMFCCVNDLYFILSVSKNST